MARTPVTTDITPVEKSVWVRWMAHGLPAAGYIILKNSADRSFDITEVKSPDYEKVTLYQSVVDGENQKMVKLDKFTVPAKGEFGFAPGEHHIFFEKPTRAIKPGDQARVIFYLDDGKAVKVYMPVRTSPELY
ncbi:copper chaperone PCu(A)C [Streptomyces achromogenes]|uniref:copper chaperone PCu(A)C n=1 Tax=Streptomyces achromogenes TaxID=67255 RepID=UPI0036B5F535